MGFGAENFPTKFFLRNLGYFPWPLRRVGDGGRSPQGPLRGGPCQAHTGKPTPKPLPPALHPTQGLGRLKFPASDGPAPKLEVFRNCHRPKPRPPVSHNTHARRLPPSRTCGRFAWSLTYTAPQSRHNAHAKVVWLLVQEALFKTHEMLANLPPFSQYPFVEPALCRAYGQFYLRHRTTAAPLIPLVQNCLGLLRGMSWPVEFAMVSPPTPPRPTAPVGEGSPTAGVGVSSGTHPANGEGRCPPSCGPGTEQWNRDGPGAPLAQPLEGKEGGGGG